MIGNDIVDLAIAKNESNWRRKGYLNKIFHPSEQLLINNAAEPDQIVWRLWSMKEAVYKIYHRQTQLRSYNPLAFECFFADEVNNILYGKVYFGNQLFQTKTITDRKFIHTLAAEKNTVLENISIVYANKSNSFSKKHSIRKNESGIPFIVDSFGLAHPVSISHHGQFCSYISTLKII